MTTYRITLKSLAKVTSAPDYIRLRQLLKCALRAFGFRCTNIEVITEDQMRDP